MSKAKSKNKKGDWSIILHNDIKLSFDHVINCLVDVCGHNQYQAHQCALIVHTNKQCAIFVDSHDECVAISEMLIKFGLTVTIKKYEKHT